MRFVAIVSFLFFVYGLISAFLGYIPWYSYFVVGGAIFLACINYTKGENTLIGLYKENKKKLVEIYLLYTVAALLIELVGRGILGLWQYNFASSAAEIINVFLVTYQFAFFFIYELHTLLKKRIKSPILLFVALVLVNALMHEFPNTFAHEWVYAIPYVSFEILSINIVVVVGWSILIAVPLFVRKLLR